MSKIKICTFQSREFVDKLINKGSIVADVSYMSDTTFNKYKKYLDKWLEEKNFIVDDRAPIWGFVNYRDLHKECSMSMALLRNYLSVICWYRFGYNCLIELEVDEKDIMYIYDDLEYDDEYKINDYAEMDKERLIACLMKDINIKNVVSIYAFSKPDNCDFKPELFYEKDMSPEELKNSLCTFVNRRVRQKEYKIDINKYRVLKVLYSTQSTEIVKNFLFNIDSTLDIDLLEYKGFMRSPVLDYVKSFLPEKQDKSIETLKDLYTYIEIKTGTEKVDDDNVVEFVKKFLPPSKANSINNFEELEAYCKNMLKYKVE